MNALTVKEFARLAGQSERHARRYFRAKQVRPGNKLAICDAPIEVQNAVVKRAAHNGMGVVPAAPVALSLVNDQQILPLVANFTSNAHPASESDNEMRTLRYNVIAALVRPDEHTKLWTRLGTASQVTRFLSEQHWPILGVVPERTIWRWKARYENGGIPALADRARGGKGKGRADTTGHGMNDAAQEFLRSALRMAGAEKRSVSEIAKAYEFERKLRASHPHRGTPLPATSYRTLCRWWEQIMTPVKDLAIHGEKRFRDKHELIIHRDIAKMRPLEYVVMDHRMLDIHCLAPGGDKGWRLIRPWVTAAIDNRTRKWLAWVIVETPSSDSIAAAILRAILNHGLPECMYWDNGRDFCCEWLEGGNSVRSPKLRSAPLDQKREGVLQMLGINILHAIPENARAKIIEPNFLRLSQKDQALPWWGGHNSGARNERFAEMEHEFRLWLDGKAPMQQFPMIDEVAAIYDRAFNELNAEQFHPGAEGMRAPRPGGGVYWMSPDEAWADQVRKHGANIRRADPATLQMAFLQRKTIKVAHGEVGTMFGGRRYHYRLIDAPETLIAFNDREVEIGYDPHDLGTVALYHDKRFLGFADNLELRGMRRDELKRADLPFQRDIRDQRAQRRAGHQYLAAIPHTYPALLERLSDREPVAAAAALPSLETIAMRALTSSCDTTPTVIPNCGDGAAKSATNLPTAGHLESVVSQEEPSSTFDFFGGE